MADKKLSFTISAQNLASSVFKELGSDVKKFAKSSVNESKKFAAGFLAISASVGLVAKSGVEMAAQLEQERMAFKTLLGSVEEADKALKMIKEDAANTPFELPGLIQANKLLTAVTKDAAKSEKILLDVGKALSAMGKGQPELDRIIINLQQIGAVGKASMLDIKQFAFAGIPIFEMLQETTGKTGEALQDMIRDGEVTFELLTELFNNAASEGGRFESAFEDQAGTFNQLVSNMKDNFTVFIGDFVQKIGLMDLLKDAVKRINDVFTDLMDTDIISWLKQNEDTLQMVAGAIMGALLPAVVALSLAFIKMMAVLSPWMLLGVFVVKNFKQIKEVISALLPVITAAATAFALLKASAMATSAWAAVRASIASMTGGLVGMTGAVVAVKGALVAAKVAAMAFLATPLGLAIVGITTAVGIVTAVWQKHNKALKEARAEANRARKQFDDLADSVENQFNRIIGAQKELNFNDAISEIRKLKGVTEENFDRILGVIRDRAALTGDLGRFFAINFARGMTSSDSISQLRNAGIAVTSAMLEGIRGTGILQAQLLGEEIVGGIAAGISSGLPAVDSILNTFANSVGKKFGFVIGATSNLKDKFTQFMGQVSASANKTKKKVGGSAGSMEDDMEDLAEAAREMSDKIASRTDRVITSYNSLKGEISDLAESHRKSVSGMTDEIADYEEKINQLTLPSGERETDFRAEAAQKVLDIQKEITNLKDSRGDRESVTQEDIDRLKFLETALKNNSDFIKGIDAEVQEAKKVAGMDELTRMRYLFDQETEELKNKYNEQIVLLTQKIASETSEYQKLALEKTKLLQRYAVALMGHLEGNKEMNKDYLDWMKEQTGDNFAAISTLIEDQANSPELETYLKKMDEIIRKSEQAISAAKKAGSLSFGFANGGTVQGGLTGFANGGVVDRPTNALIGEGSMNEAVVPLPDGRSIPVNMKGGQPITIIVQGSVLSEDSLLTKIKVGLARELAMIN